MKIKLDSWTIVIVGLWNTYIFSPDWLAKSLLGREEIAIEFLIATGKPQVRFSTDQLIFAAVEDKIVIAPKDSKDQTLSEVERVAKRLIELLPHTPVSGIGINMGFTVDELPPAVLRSFALEDTHKLSAEGITIENTDIVRRLRTEDELVNLRIASGATSSPELHFNFHRDILANASTSDKLLPLTSRILRCRDFAYGLLDRVYDLRLEQGDNA